MSLQPVKRFNALTSEWEEFCREPSPGDGNLLCAYEKGHTGDHSWTDFFEDTPVEPPARFKKLAGFVERAETALHFAKWVCFGICVSLILINLVQCPAHASPESLEDWTLRKALSLPVYYEDHAPGGIAELTTDKRTELETLAREVARVSRKAPLPPRQWAALLLTVGYHESTYSIRIVQGDCRKYECDGGRARGAFQGHRLAAMTAETWSKMVGIGNLPTQVEQADQLLRRHVRTCPGDVVTSIVTGYMGKRCGGEDAQVAERLATFRRLQ